MVLNYSQPITLWYITLSDRNLDPDLGMDIHPKMGTVVTGDLSPDMDLNPSLCDVNMFCLVQCSHQVWNLNMSRYLNPCPTM